MNRARRRTLTCAVAVAIGGAPVTSSHGRAGDLDQSFGERGKARIGLSREGTVTLRALARRPNGGLLVLGSYGDKALVVGYRPDGRLDASFAADGRLMLGEDPAQSALLVQRDGRIVMAGGGDGNGFELVRREADGSLDPTFGSGGRATAAFVGGTATASDLSELPDGRLMATGTDSAVGRGLPALARFLPDGSLDESFGVGGRVTSTLGPGSAGITDHIVQPDGKLVALVAYVDETRQGPGRANLSLLRYNVDGSLDATFGEAGKALVLERTFTSGGLALDSTGRFLVAGGIFDRPFVARLLSDGSLDATFGRAGRRVLYFHGLPVRRRPLYASTMVLSTGGGVVIGGPLRDDSDFALAALTRRGAVDRRFGEEGHLFTKFGPGGNSEYVRELLVAPDHRLIAGGDVSCCRSRSEFLLARYHLQRFGAIARLPRRLALRTVARDGATVRVRCTQACDVRVALRVNPRVARGLKMSQIVGRSNVALGRAGTRSARVKLKRSTLQKLRRRRRTPLELGIQFDAAGREREGIRRNLILTE